MRYLKNSVATAGLVLGLMWLMFCGVAWASEGWREDGPLMVFLTLTGMLLAALACYRLWDSLDEKLSREATTWCEMAARNKRRSVALEAELYRLIRDKRASSKGMKRMARRLARLRGEHWDHVHNAASRENYIQQLQKAFLAGRKQAELPNGMLLVTNEDGSASLSLGYPGMKPVQP